MLLPILTILLLAFVQNVSFSIVSRSRNRNNLKYHLIASVFSNGIWFLTFRQLILADMTFVLFVPYCVGTVTGSLTGAKVSMFIERRILAYADEHRQSAFEKLESEFREYRNQLEEWKTTAEELYRRRYAELLDVQKKLKEQ